MRGALYTLSMIVMLTSLFILSEVMLSDSLKGERMLAREFASLNMYELSGDLLSQVQDCLDLKLKKEGRNLTITQYIEQDMDIEENIVRMEEFWNGLKGVRWDFSELKENLPLVEYTIEPMNNNITWGSNIPSLGADLEGTASLEINLRFNSSCTPLWKCSPGNCTFPAGGYKVSITGCGSESVGLNISQEYTYTMITSNGNITIGILPLDQLVIDYSSLSVPAWEQVGLRFGQEVKRIAFRNIRAPLNISTAFEISRGTELFFGE